MKLLIRKLSNLRLGVGDALIARLLLWVVAWPRLSVCLMILAVIGSSFGVIYSAHTTRQLYAELQALQNEQDFLDSEYEKLLLEQSAYANYTRVDQVSRESLGMASPDANDVVVVSR